MKKVMLLFILILLFGCAQQKDFMYGVKQISELNAKYGTDMETYPKSLQKIDSMTSDYKELKKLQLDGGQEPFNYLIDYRVLNLEAEKLYIQGQKYGNSGTTEYGFGCKQRPLVIESVAFRNSSALKGFEAAGLLVKFVEKYPEEANSVNLTLKNAIFLNATFYEISRIARRNSRIIDNFCPANVTLELYREEFRKKTNLSQDFIKNLTYEQAVPIWKEIRGIQ